ncbi:MAG TPA: acyl carrier protein [Actinocrinis sp.]|nr:acyl carrier protein [Actinocrinis sp.]
MPSQHGPQWLRIAALPPADRTAACAAVVEAEFKTALMMDEHDELAAEQNLFDLGLNSLRAVEAKERLESDFGCRIDITDLFDRPTVRGLTAHLARGPLAELFPADSPPAPNDAALDNAAPRRAEHRAAVDELLNRLYKR